MADEERETPPPEGPGAGANRWKLPVAGLVIVAMVALVAYVTIRTGHIPVEVALPLIGGASAAIFGFSRKEWTRK